MAMLSNTKDVSEFKEIEDALEEHGDIYRTILNTIADPVVLFDIECKVEYFNPSFTCVFGWTIDESLGKSLNVFFPEYVWPEIRKINDTLLAAKSITGIATHCCTKEGQIIHASISGAVYRDKVGNPRGCVLNFRDISGQKNLEKHIQQNRKMEAISTLAGGIAHEFNNLLMGIQGHAALMQMKIGPHHPHVEHLKRIEDCVKSSAKLTKQLLGFARGGKYEVKPTDMNEIIDKSADRFGRTKNEVAIHIESQKDIWLVEVDQNQIEQVLLNLYVNAWQAMPGGGDLFIQTENVMVNENYKMSYRVELGKYVKISLTDTGVGMNKAIQERIFDPFFTTKRMTGGIGLGLSSVYGIIKNHGGYIDVCSEKNIGTKFEIYLPASEKEQKTEIFVEVLRGTETILLIDDDEMIMLVNQDMIGSLGYKVLTAKNGKEALEIYKKNMAKIDMIMLDMIMPVMDGGETYTKLKEINPDIKVLFSSGYGINSKIIELLNRGCNSFIQKPFDMKTLSIKIRSVLDKN